MRNRLFERWFANRLGCPVSDVQSMWTGSTYESRSYHVELAWAAWCAALGFTPSAT